MAREMGSFCGKKKDEYAALKGIGIERERDGFDFQSRVLHLVETNTLPTATSGPTERGAIVGKL